MPRLPSTPIASLHCFPRAWCWSRWAGRALPPRLKAPAESPAHHDRHCSRGPTRPSPAAQSSTAPAAADSDNFGFPDPLECLNLRRKPIDSRPHRAVNFAAGTAKLCLRGQFRPGSWTTAASRERTHGDARAGMPGFAPYIQYPPGTPENQFAPLKTPWGFSFAAVARARRRPNPLRAAPKRQRYWRRCPLPTSRVSRQPPFFRRWPQAPAFLHTPVPPTPACLCTCRWC